MEYLFLYSLVILYLTSEYHVKANLVTFGAGLVGVKVEKECNDVVDKWTNYAKKEVFQIYIKQKKCKEAKCKATFEEAIKYWPQVKISIDAILAKVVQMGGPNTRQLPGTCAGFQKELNAVMWGDVNNVADLCVLKPGTAGFRELHGDPCTITQEKMKGTGDCIKGHAIRLAMKYVGLVKLDKAQKCMNEILSKYCNEQHLGKWLKYNLKDSFDNRNEYGRLNAFNHIDKYFGEYNCIAHPLTS